MTDPYCNPATLGDQLEDLLRLGTDWVWQQDRELRITDLIGKTPDGADYRDADTTADLIGKTLSEIGLRAHDPDAYQAYLAAVDARRPFHDLVVYRTLPNGKRCYVSVSGVPMFDSRRSWLGYRGIGRDISHCVSQQEELLRLQTVLDALPDPVVVAEYDTARLVFVNDTACRRLGLPRDELLKIPGHVLARRSPEELADIYAETLARGPEGLTTPPLMLVSIDGSRRGWWQSHWRAVDIGNRIYVITVSRDVTQRLLAEQAAQRAQRMYAVLSATNEAIMRERSIEALYQQVCDIAVREGHFAGASILIPAPDSPNVRVVAHSGIGEDYLRQAKIALDPSRPEGQGLVGSAFRTGQTQVSNDFLADPRTRQWHTLAERAQAKAVATVPIMRGDTAVGVLYLAAVERRAFDGETVGLLERMAANIGFALANLEHEAERKHAEERIQYLATHDSLTGLPNRVLFSQLLNQALQAAHQEQRKLALMFVDLDRFKLVNDTLGHEAGDLLLKELSARLRQTVRTNDVVARLGGDEFVILLRDMHSLEDTEIVARKVLNAAISPVIILGQECRVSASIGISLFPDHGRDEHALMKHADIAMYAAKEEGKNTFQIYSPQLRAESLERLSLESALRTALEEDQFVLYYQSKLDLNSKRITGVEALLRWQHPELGVIAPGQFMSLAEEMGITIPLGRWVLKTACHQSIAWQREGLPPIPLSVNLSPRQFADEALLDDVRDALQSSGLPAHLLELEITETVLVEAGMRALHILKALKEIGVRIAMDDFGGGYASLAQIRPFPLDAIKVDRAFIRGLANSPQGVGITQSIIAMAKTLRLEVVAKGVETQEQEDILRRIACDQSQGFYFAPPAPAQEFAELLRRHSPTGPR